MNRRQLFEHVARELRCPQTQAERVVRTVLEGIQRGLVEDGRVALTGFGTFDVRSRRARRGWSPVTGGPLDLPASKHVHFRAGTHLRRAIDPEEGDETEPEHAADRPSRPSSLSAGDERAPG